MTEKDFDEPLYTVPAAGYVLLPKETAEKILAILQAEEALYTRDFEHNNEIREIPPNDSLRPMMFREIRYQPNEPEQEDAA